MKFSALILFLLLPVAIAQTVAVRISVNNTGLTNQTVMQIQAFMDAAASKVKYNRALADQDRIDTEMVEVKEVSAPELPTTADPDHHRVLRGQNRELQSCSVLCSGLPPPCRVSCLSELRQQLCKSVLTFDACPSHFVAFNRTGVLSLVSPPHD